MLVKEENYISLLSRVLEEVLWTGRGRSVLLQLDGNSDFEELVRPFLRQVPASVGVISEKMESQAVLPFYPFLNWVKAKAGGMDKEGLERLLASARVYYPQRSVFLSGLMSGGVYRDEEMIPEELEYELIKIRESMLGVFTSVFRGHQVIIIENIELLPFSSLEWLNFLLERGINGPYLLLFTTRHHFYNDQDKYGQKWNTLFGNIELKSVVIDMRNPFYSRGGAFAEPGAVSMPDREAYQAACLCYHFLAFDDCEKLVSRLLAFQSHPEIDLPLSDRLERLQLAGNLFYYMRKHDNALLYFQAVVTLAKDSGLDVYLQHAYRRTAQVYYKKNNMERARKFSMQSLKLAEQGKDNRTVFYALSTYLLIDDKENRMEQTQWIQFYYRVLELVSALGFKNSLAYWMTRPERFGPQTHRGDIAALLDRSIRLSLEIGNEARLSAAYHAKGLYHILNNEYDRVEAYYRKSERLKQKIGNTQILAQLQNGMGYFFFQTGRYSRADLYFRKAYDSAVLSDDYYEIGMAVCNIGINYLVCFEFAAAAEYFENLVQIMKGIGIEDLPYHTRTGIYTLLAVCYYKMGSTTKFLELYTYIEMKLLDRHYLTRLQNFTEEEFLLILLRAYNGQHNGDPAAAEKSYRDCEAYFLKNYKLIKYLGPFLYVDIALFYRDSGDRKGASAAFRKGIAEIRAQGSRAYLAVYGKSPRDLGRGGKVLGRKKPALNFGMVMEGAIVSQSLVQLHKKVEELDFLNSFQNVLTAAKSAKELVELSMKMLMSSFPLDVLMFGMEREGRSELLYYQAPYGRASEHFKRLQSLFDSYREREEILRTEVKNTISLSEMDVDLSSLVSIPMKSRRGWSACLFCATVQGSVPLSNSEFQILSLSCKQLQSSLEKLEQEQEIKEKNRMLEEKNAQLVEIATRDALTNLYNRQSMIQKIKESETIRNRYGGRDKGLLSVLFVDLDNFKYYNDTFGHSEGDMILVEFGKILKDSVRECDFTARFGGDEFIVLLPETDTQGAVMLAERLLENVRARDSFRELLEARMGMKVIIPFKRKLSCSIGIASNEKNSETGTSELMKFADIALYQAKENGRDGFSVFQYAPTA